MVGWLEASLMSGTGVCFTVDLRGSQACVLEAAFSAYQPFDLEQLIERLYI